MPPPVEKPARTAKKHPHARDEIERRARAVSMLWKELTGRFPAPTVCREYAELAFEMPEFLAEVRRRFRAIVASGKTPTDVRGDWIWRLAQEMHHEALKTRDRAERPDLIRDLARNFG